MNASGLKFVSSSRHVYNTPINVKPQGVGNRSCDWDFNIFFNKNQISQLQGKATGQNPHPNASEGGQMSFKP